MSDHVVGEAEPGVIEDPAAELAREREGLAAHAGKTVARVEAEEGEYGSSIVTVTFTDGTRLRLWGCGCCDSPVVLPE